jgi:cytochrome c2
LGIHRTVLTALLLLVLLPLPAVAARRSACLACHAPHYMDRGSCVDCHRGNDRTDRKEIAHYGFIAGKFAHFTIKGSRVVEQGEKLAEVLACRRCHVYGKKGNPLAADLGRLAPDIEPSAIFDSIKSPVLFMPNFQCDDAQIAAIVNLILAGAESADVGVRETAQVVHFDDGKQSRENGFVKQCGPCHKVLSGKFGGLGIGDIGPNLSGFLSEFYPKTYRDVWPWSTENLTKWLENPRNSRPNARMRPVRLKTSEFTSLIETLRINPKLASEVPPDHDKPATFRLRR